MPSTTPLPGNEVLAKAIAASPLHSGRRPIPLVSTAYRIRICGGLADVEATRTFRNVEKGSIEATLTFPMPVHAVVYALEAEIGERTLHACVRTRSTARADYESAIDRGKTAVLHEELLKGIHLLSIGHIPPGTGVTVKARFALALSCVGSRVFLRVPLTVGDVYGDPGLPDSDALTHGGGPTQVGTLDIACDSGTPELIGGALAGGKASIPLNAPLVVEVKDWQPRVLYARSASHRHFKLTIGLAPEGDGTIDAAILVDHSGSMGSPCAVDAGLNKHAAALLGLSEAAAKLRDGDRLHLFEFDDDVTGLGSATASDWRDKLHQLSPPRGGTEIGRALEAVRKQTPARDVLLITDGKSHAIDIQKLARSGQRYSVVLIGEDSLEANVAHLAAMTGGDILVPDGTKVAPAIAAMLGIIRCAGAGAATGVRRGGMLITVEPASGGAPACDIARAVAAYVAGIRLASLPEAEAVPFAEAEGLLTPMTSFILVDEDGQAQQGLPATRKVDLPSPRAYAMAIPRKVAMPRAAKCSIAVRSDTERSLASLARKRQLQVEAPGDAPATPSVELRPDRACVARTAPWRDLSALGRRIPWSASADRLTAGDLSVLEPAVAAQIQDASASAIIRKLAAKMRLQPLLLVIAMLALSEGARSRHANRIARAILGTAPRSGLTGAAEWFGLVIPGAETSPAP